jgi:hypothetical protein
LRIKEQRWGVHQAYQLDYHKDSTNVDDPRIVDAMIQPAGIDSWPAAFMDKEDVAVVFGATVPLPAGAS